MRPPFRITVKYAMSAFARSVSPRLASLSGALLLIVGMAGSAPVIAQTTVRMTTPQQTECVAVTDAQGLQLVAGSTDLQATGVTLTGSGCGTPASFGAAVSAPGTATTGNAFDVTWSATSDATVCTYGGSPTTGTSGWNFGQTACTSSATCAGTHTVPVTASAAGNYNFAVTCTNASGYAVSGSVAVTQSVGLPTPDNFALNAPSTATVGSAFSVSWSVSGATSCTGSAELNGSSTSLPGWTDVTTATSPRTVTASTAGTYNLQLTCSNTAGSIVSQTASVSVSAVDTGCSVPGLTRMTTGNIIYPNTSGVNSSRNNVDLTQFANIWGYASTNDTTPVSWPGVSGAQPAIRNIGKTQFIAAKFNVSSTVDTTLYGWFGYGSYYSGPAVTIAISPTCGDFAPAISACVSTHYAGESFSKWFITPTTSGQCTLGANTDYYVNMKMANPVTSDCGGASTCTLAINNTVSHH